MDSKDILMDLHKRVHVGFQSLLDHCMSLTAEEFNRELEGFGYPTVRLQLHHMIGAQKYWVGVLEGRIDADEDEHLYPDIEAMIAYREEIFKLTETYLSKASSEELTIARQMTTWGGNVKTMKPLNVILRTQTHIFHHQGQVLAMCRLLGKPGGGVDYPLV